MSEASVARARREAGFGENVDVAATVSPHEGARLPRQHDLVEAFAADKRIVVAEGDLGFRKHDLKLRVSPVDLKTAGSAAGHRPRRVGAGV